MPFFNEPRHYPPERRGYGARNPRTPVYIVCSPRPRVGKTLLARLLTEFHALEGRPVMAFDASPNEPGLSDYLPRFTSVAALGDTRAKMELFDQLIVADGVTKIVDLAHQSMEAFFTIVHELGFCEAAHDQGVEPIALLVTEPHPALDRAANVLTHRFPALRVIPVHNQALSGRHRFRAKLLTQGVAMRLPALPQVLNAVIDRKGFSFARFLERPVVSPTELHLWINRILVDFRTLDLRLLFEQIRPVFDADERYW